MEVKVDANIIDAAAGELISKFCVEMRDWLENDPVELMEYVATGKFPKDITLLAQSAFKVMEVLNDIEEMNYAKAQHEEKFKALKTEWESKKCDADACGCGC